MIQNSIDVALGLAIPLFMVAAAHIFLPNDKLTLPRALGFICGFVNTLISPIILIYFQDPAPYGLTAGVYTRDEKRASAILSQVRAGSVYWNCCDRVSPRLPWSGVGQSGVGLTLSAQGIETFTRVKGYHLRSA